MIEATTKTRIRMTEDAPAMESARHAGTLSDAIKYLDRIDDRELVKEALKKRFATGLVKATTGASAGTDGSYDTSVAGSGYDTYVKGKAGKAIDVDIYEVVTTGIYGRVAGEVANLFHQPGQDWTYFTSQGVEDDELKELVFEHREAGQYSEAMGRLDKLSVGVNCAFLRLQWVAGHLSYEVLRPQSVHVQWPDEIREDSESGEQTRDPMVSDLEDALSVIVKLAGDNSWIAYVARSEKHPDGRCFTFEADAVDDLPAVGDDKIKWEYTVGDEPANPLTWLQNDRGSDVVKYEYPIIRLLGSDAASDQRVIATSVSLYKRAMEIDVASSRNLTAANNAAQGITAVTDTRNVGLPESVTGPMALREGQSITVTGRDASNAVNAGMVIDNVKKEYAESEGVPAYRVLSDSSGPESGAALMIRHQPQLDRRQSRVKLNQDQILKLGFLEVYFLDMHTSSVDVTANLQIDWNEGKWQPPRAMTEIVQELKEALDLGAIDEIEMVRRFHQLETRQDAEALIAERKPDASKMSTVDRIIGGLENQRLNFGQQNTDGGSTPEPTS
jgi:hypothetical protein